MICSPVRHKQAVVKYRNQEIPIYYFTTGQGKTPIVFLHGLGGSHLELEKIIIPHINMRCKLIAPDQLGHGHSGSIENVTIKDLVQTLKIFLDTLKIKKTVFIGWSMGGTVGLLFSSLFPQYVRAVVSVSPVYYGGKLGPLIRLVAKAIRNAVYCSSDPDGLQKDIVRLFRLPTTALRIFEYSDMNIVSPEFMHIIDEDTRLVRSKTYFDLAVEFTRIDLRSKLSNISVPVLLVSGDRGLLSAAQNIEDLAKFIPGASKYIIKGAGHLAPVSHPREFAGAVENFISALA